MTARQWLEQQFRVGSDGFFPLGPKREGNADVFVALFGATIEAALNANPPRNPVDDLRALPEVEKRGWGPDFEVWGQHRSRA